MTAPITRTVDPITGIVFVQEFGFPGAYDHWEHPKNPNYEIIYGNDEFSKFVVCGPDGNVLGDEYETLEEAIKALMIYL